MSTKVLIPNNPAEADPRTRDHIYKVALILNDLIRAGKIDLSSGGTYTIPTAASLEGVFFGKVPPAPAPRLDEPNMIFAGRFFNPNATYGVIGG